MTIFLTSTVGGVSEVDGFRSACKLIEDNRFIENLNKIWKSDAKCIMIASNPDSFKINDQYLEIFKEAFTLSGLNYSSFIFCDRRNEDILEKEINNYDVIILAGGHVPTQNDFFKKIKLKNLLDNYNGIIIGISAGSMNASEIVYAQPEYDDEVNDQSYKKYLKGLGLTKISILPHYQYLKDQTIGGLRVLEDISIPDSLNRGFYALVDGSYILINSEKTEIFGEAYFINEATINQVCELNNSIEVKQ